MWERIAEDKSLAGIRLGVQKIDVRENYCSTSEMGTSPWL